MPHFLPVPLRRLGYRIGYLLLSTYWFVRRPRLRGVKFVLSNGDQVLLVVHTYGRREWEIPGGGIKRSETPAEAARREAHEELGVRIGRWEKEGEVNVYMHHRHGTLNWFQAELHDPALEVDKGEIAAARWFERSALPAKLSRYVLPLLQRT